METSKILQIQDGTNYYQKGQIDYNRDRELWEVCKIRILISRPVKKNQDNDIVITKAILGVLELVKAWKE